MNRLPGNPLFASLCEKEFVHLYSLQTLFQITNSEFTKNQVIFNYISLRRSITIGQSFYSKKTPAERVYLVDSTIRVKKAASPHITPQNFFGEIM